MLPKKQGFVSLSRKCDWLSFSFYVYVLLSFITVLSVGVESGVERKCSLSIKRISLQFNVTEKIIKGSKKFIITVIIIFDKNYRNLKLWIKR